VSKWTSVDEYHWRLGRYFVNRALAYDLNPIGHWVYLGAFKAHEGAAPDLVSPERRHKFEDAARDCMAHAKGNSEQRPEAA
jgi:hypothetical protein